MTDQTAPPRFHLVSTSLRRASILAYVSANGFLVVIAGASLVIVVAAFIGRKR